MQDLVIQTQNLSFNFGNQTVLNQLSLEVPQGGIYGFLGPNGSGKTTTIKLLLNLLQSKEKNILLFGKDLKENRKAILKKIGSLVEQPAIYAHLSGYENLKLRSSLLEISSVKVNDVLELVGLTEAARKMAGKYSLGMKQRLGIGLALISDPELLILDEPTNGLDPNGIIEIRNLMKDLSENHHKTIFISSHLLTEIERIATHVGIIDKGKLLFQGSIQNLHSVNSAMVCIQTNNNTAATEFLKTNFPLVKLTEEIQLPYTSMEDMGLVNSLLIANNFTVYSIYKKKKDLESLFLDITNS